MVSGLHHQVSLRQILKDFRQVFAAIQCRGHLVGIVAGKLEQNVRADGHDGRAHLRRILIQKLVCGDHADAEFPGFGKQSIEAAIEGDEVLDLVAVQREQLRLRRANSAFFTLVRSRLPRVAACSPSRPLSRLKMIH